MEILPGETVVSTPSVSFVISSSLNAFLYSPVSYYVVSNQLRLALGSGFMAVKVTIAIVLGIIIISELPNRFFHFRKRR